MDTLINETIFLLRKNQPDQCENHIYLVGDCKSDDCEFCRIEKCIDNLENKFGN